MLSRYENLLAEMFLQAEHRLSSYPMRTKVSLSIVWAILIEFGNHFGRVACSHRLLLDHDNRSEVLGGNMGQGF